MKIAVCVDDGAKYAPLLVAALAEDCRSDELLVVIRRAECPEHPVSAALRFAREAGLLSFLELLADLIRRRFRDPLGDKVSEIPTLDSVVGQFGLSFHITPDVNHEQSIQAVREFQPDLVILAYLLQIVSDDFLATKLGRVINCHPAPLPEYAGINTGYYMLADKVTRGCATVHYTESGIDSGPVIDKEYVDVRENESVRSLSRRTAFAMTKCLCRVVGQFRDDHPPPGESQDLTKRRYYSKLNRAVIRGLRKNGFRVL